MSEGGRDRRAEMDNTTVRALLMMNGGGALALVAFLGNIATEPVLVPLAKWVLWGVLLFHLGLFAAVVHNHLRRRCSLAYEKGDVTGDTGVCRWSWLCLFASIVLFFFAGVVVVIGGLKTFGAG